jgi:hypothetical protein
MGFGPGGGDSLFFVEKDCGAFNEFGNTIPTVYCETEKHSARLLGE